MPDQVNEFFNNYGLDLNYNTVATSGLEPDEICKPLFCWLIAIVHARNMAISIPGQFTLNRILLFSTIIHEVILGKESSAAEEYGYRKHGFNEKLVLRKIAELKHVYGDSLTKNRVLTLLKRSRVHINPKVLEVYNKLISTYFYTTFDPEDYDERLDFVHRSFEEYLLAEYYIECFLRKEPYRINLKLPTDVTIKFVNGLLELFKTDNSQLKQYAEKMTKTFRSNLDHNSIKTELLSRSNEWYDNESVQHIPRGEYPNFNEPAEYSSLHRWLAIIVINSLTNRYGIDKTKFFKLQIATHGSIPDYIIQLENIDLSGFEFEGNIPNLKLVKANLQNCKLHGTFYGTDFSGANLSNSTFEQGPNFTGCNFSGTHLTGMKIKIDSPYPRMFTDCNFSNCDLTRATLSDSRFSDCNFSVTFGGIILNSCNLGTVIFDKKPNTKGIELLGKDDGSGFNKEWDELKSNKDLISYILSEVDDKLREVILNDNPDLRFGSS